MENTVQLLLRHTTHQSVEGGEEDGDKKALTFRVLQSVIIYLRRKSDFARSLLTSSGDVDKFWQQHLHYTTALSTDNEARPSSRILGGSKFSPGESKASLTASRTSLTASRTSLTASRTSLTASRSNLPSSKITQSAGLPGPSLGTAKLHPYLSSPALRSPSSPAGSSAAASRTSIHSSLGDHLQISSPSPCTLHAGGLSVGYGFEYYGPAPQVVMTPAMESGVIAIVTAIAQYQFPGVTGERESQRTETVNEVVKVSYNLPPSTSSLMTHTHPAIREASLHIHMLPTDYLCLSTSPGTLCPVVWQLTGSRGPPVSPHHSTTHSQTQSAGPAVSTGNLFPTHHLSPTQWTGMYINWCLHY